jgi:hypothetical protein
VDPSYFLILDDLKFRAQRTLFKLCEKALTPLHYVLWLGTVSVGLVIVRAIVITLPFLASFTLDAVSFSTPVFDPIEWIFVADNIVQLSFVPILVVLL